MHKGDAWLPPRFEGEPAPKSASGFETGTEVKHITYGRTGVVDSVRELTRPAKDGSKWMLRVRWDEGGVAFDGDVNFIRVKDKPRAVLAMESLWGE